MTEEVETALSSMTHAALLASDEMLRRKHVSSE